MNEIMKKETETSLDLMGDFSLQGLPEEVKQTLREKVQEAKIEIAKDVAQKKLDLQASSTGIDITINTANRLEQGKNDYHISSMHKTGNWGQTEVKVSRNTNNGMLAVMVIVGIVLIIVLAKCL